MENPKSILIDEEPMYFYSSDKYNFGVYSKKVKSPKNIHMSFSPLSTNGKITFTNTIMNPIITKEATLDTEQSICLLNDEKLKQPIKIESISSKDVKNARNYAKKGFNTLIIKNNDSIKEEDTNKNDSINNEEDKRQKDYLDRYPFSIYKKSCKELNLNNYINFSKTSKNLKREIIKTRFNRKCKDKQTLNLNIIKKSKKNELEIMKKYSHKDKIYKTKEIKILKETEKIINSKNNMIKPRTKTKEKTIINKPLNNKLKDYIINRNHANHFNNRNGSSKDLAERIFKDKMKLQSEKKINSKFNIKTPKNNTQIKLSLMYNKQFNQNINIKSRKSNNSLSFNMKKSSTFQNNNISCEKKKILAIRKKKSMQLNKNFDFELALKNKNNLDKTQFNLFSPNKFTETEFCDSDYCEYTLDCMNLLLNENRSERQQKNKVNFNFPKPTKNKKKKIAIFDLDETLIHCTGDIKTNKEPHQHDIKISLPGGKEIIVGINIRPFWKKTLNLIKRNYHIIAFTASHQAYADAVLDFMDPNKKYFKYRLYRNNCSLVEIEKSKFYVKDLNIFDEHYDLKDIVIIDNSVLSFIYHLENGIPIVPYYNEDKDGSLYVVGLYLNHIYKENDLREANKNYINLDSFLNEAKKRKEENKDNNTTISEESVYNEKSINNNNDEKNTKNTSQIKLNTDKKEIQEKHNKKYSSFRRHSTCFSFKNQSPYKAKLINQSRLLSTYYSINDRYILNENTKNFIDKKYEEFCNTDDEKDRNYNDKNITDLLFNKRLNTSNILQRKGNNRFKNSNKTCDHYIELNYVHSKFYSNFE